MYYSDKTMYCQFYHLTHPPFQLSTEHNFLWEGKNYVKSLQALRQGLEQHSGLSLLTGGAGSGKTTVIRALLKSLDTRVHAAFIPDSSLSVSEFYSLVAHSLSLPGKLDHRDVVIKALHTFLDQAGAGNKQVLLVVDEAQQLSPELIVEIKALLDLQTGNSTRLNICLVGQLNNDQEAGGSIEHAFANYVLVRYSLAPCTREETCEYITHRLGAAGAKQKIFTEDALAAVYRYSKGYPGQINIICDLSLFSGFNDKSPEINAARIQASAEKMQFPEEENGGIEALAVTCWENRQHDTCSDLNEKIAPQKVLQVPITAEHTGRSYAMSALVVFVGVLFIGAGYVYYKKQAAAVSVLTEPETKNKTFAVEPVVSVSKPSLPKERDNFDAVGYSAPIEDDFVYEQEMKQAEEIIDIVVSEDVPEENSVAHNTTNIQVKGIIPPVVEDTEFQLGETFSPVADCKRTGSAQEAASFDPEKGGGELIFQTEKMDTALSRTEKEKQPLSGYNTENIVISTVEGQSEAILPPQTREVFLGATEYTVGSRDGDSVIGIVAEEDVVLPVAEENTRVVAATKEIAHPVAAAGSALTTNQEQQVLLDSFPTGDEYGAGEITATVKQRTAALQTVFNQGAFTSSSVAAPVAVSSVGPKEAKVNAPQSQNDPQPEDVIDWLLKKKGIHAKK